MPVVLQFEVNAYVNTFLHHLHAIAISHSDDPMRHFDEMHVAIDAGAMTQCHFGIAEMTNRYDRACLLTGGLGGLGLLCAHRLCNMRQSVSLSDIKGYHELPKSLHSLTFEAKQLTLARRDTMCAEEASEAMTSLNDPHVSIIHAAGMLQVCHNSSPQEKNMKGVWHRFLSSIKVTY